MKQPIAPRRQQDRRENELPKMLFESENRFQFIGRNILERRVVQAAPPVYRPPQAALTPPGAYRPKRCAVCAAEGG